MDPSIRPADARYRYRVAVEVTGSNGQVERTVAQFDSDTQMSHGQIHAEVEADIEGHTSDRRSVRQAIAQIAQGATVSVLIISAGQRAR